MTLRAEQAEAALIDAACARLRDQLGPDAASGCEALLRQLYHRVPLDDLAGRSERDLCGAAIALWELARTRRPGATTVRAYNPAPDRHGWHSANTIVEVVTDYMPFLVDSVAMELAAGGYAIELSLVPVIEVLRDQRGRLVELLGPGSGVAGVQAESVMQFEVDREAQPERLDALADGIQRVLADVSAAVQDWPLMRERMQAIADDFRAAPAPLDQLQARELTAFLEWVADGNFIFLGHGEYDLLREEGEDLLRAVPGSLLGVFRHRSAGTSRSFARLPAEVRAMARAPEPLILTKANSRSTVHRPLYLDYIGVKRFSGEQVVGERRFLGLYTSDAADASPREIPLLADKVARVTRRAAFAAESHNAKALARTLDSYPLDELFQSSDDELFAVAMGIVALGERDRVGVFVRRDPYRRFVSCLVFVPRDRFNADNRERMDRILRDAFAATDIDWAVRLTASKLVRIHYIVRCEIVPFDRDAAQFSRDVADLERLIADATRPWTEQLAGALRNAHGDERGNQLLRDYRAAFPIGYRADWQAGAAVQDIERAEALASGDRVVMTVRAARETEHGSLRCKLLSPGERIALSDVLPILENMGLRVADERPYELTPAGRDPIWVYDIGVACELDADLRDQARRTALQDAFTGVWRGELENDRLGALVLLAGLTGREVSLLRALLKYLRQAGARFSDRYMQQALTGNPGLARRLVELFCVRLDPDSYDLGLAQRLAIELQRAIDDLPSADQAGILRDCLAAIQATVRTSYFQRGADGPAANPQLAFKLDPALLPFLPRPRPAIETFVYSPRVEGVYLRAARVARGAIRWSDRREDFRAEALDCMRAEIVDNAAIVAGGAYGAFVIKRPPSTGGRAALLREAADCCRLFASGLLDLTDNVVAGAIVAPARAVRHDGDDPYLVLGADARTAALAGIAHDVAAQRGFWLADSFASPGLRPQDPGPSAIGAQGTWESVRRHARGLARATRSEALTVVAIGEAPGSLFGPEQAPWPRIRLIGAVGREHVLIDPDPDPD
ncbi:MAG: NAD-glutamate dehydrogenase domain-containing protein, partial [Solirubrobacteraceae bacterium]